MEKQLIIPESEWSTSIHRTKEWENSVIYLRYEHDFVKKIIIIDYKNK